MFSLVYKSQACPNFNKDAISEMLLNSQKSNEKRGITGCLLFHRGWFVQLLEGEEDVVKALYKKIRKDDRHKSMTVLSMEESVGRIFGNWHMIYEALIDSDTGHHQNIKRQLFDDIFHGSDAVSTPGNSKLALWLQVNKLLNNEKVNAQTPKK